MMVAVLAEIIYIPLMNISSTANLITIIKFSTSDNAILVL